jgi:hypothetical protein
MSLTPEDIPVTKGLNFRTIFGALKTLYGDDCVEKTMNILPAELVKKINDGSIMPSSWYPLEWYRSIYVAARSVINNVPDLPRLVGRTQMLQDLSGIHKIFLLVVSPQFVISKASSMFNLYYRIGRMEILDSRKNYAQARFTGCVGFDSNIWQESIGSSEGALIAARAKKLRTKILSGGKDNDLDMHFEIVWD